MELTDAFSTMMFVDKVINFTATFSWTDKQSVNAALNALQSEARIWYELTVDEDPKAFESLSKFEMAFLQRFKSSGNIAAQEKLLHSHFQKQTESIMDFHERVDVMVSLISQNVMLTQANPRKGAVQIRGHFVILEFINGLQPDINGHH